MRRRGKSELLRAVNRRRLLPCWFYDGLERWRFWCRIYKNYKAAQTLKRRGVNL